MLTLEKISVKPAALNRAALVKIKDIGYYWSANRCMQEIKYFYFGKALSERPKKDQA